MYQPIHFVNSTVLFRKTSCHYNTFMLSTR